jgi:FkbM family methyltransferase
VANLIPIADLTLSLPPMFNRWLPITRLKIFGARILYFITTLFVGKHRRVVDRDGIKFEVDLSEGIELSMFLFGRFQSHITRNPYLNVRPDAVVLDVGANVGLMTLQFANMAPVGRVYAFEPTHYALERLLRNISLNPGMSDRITVLNAFVSEKSHDAPSITAYSSWKVDGQRSASDHPVHLGTPKDAAGVPAVSLDDFIEKQGISHVDLVKIDTDGHEYEVLRGARTTIAKFRPKIIFEIGLYVLDEKSIDFNFYFNYFTDLKYKLVDTKTGAVVNLSNHRKYIPMKGSTDLIAIPL